MTISSTKLFFILFVSIYFFSTKTNCVKETNEEVDEDKAALENSTSSSSSSILDSIPTFQLNKGLDELKSASFSSFNRMSYFINMSHEFNEQIDSYLSKHDKHTLLSEE
jgi:hypothetical protein